MSSDADAAAATAVIFNDIYTEGYCDVAASVLFIYDTVVTSDREVACFWTSKRSGAAFLFFANKWICTTLYMMSFISFASLPTDQSTLAVWLTGDNRSCSVFQRATEALNVLQLVPAAVFSALRAYALSQNKYTAILVLALSLAPVGSNLAMYGYSISGENFPPFGCLQLSNTTDAIDLSTYSCKSLQVTIIARVPVIVADMFLIYITWTNLSSRDALISTSKRASLSAILFRDGTIYFIVLFVLNILHLVFSLTALAVEEGGGSGLSFVTIFTGPLTAILISRFLLDLQEADKDVVRVDRDDPLYSSRNHWDDSHGAISSIGAFIDPDRPARPDDDMVWDVGSPLDGEEEGRRDEDSP